MIEGNPQPLAIAARVLKPDSLAAVRGLGDFSLRGWGILDRWALNSPEALRCLESEGEVVLLGRLLEQQRIEQRAIDRQPVGMPELEALAIAKVQLELNGPNGVAAILEGKALRRDALVQAVNDAQPADLDAAAQRIKAVLRKSPNDGPRQRLRLVPRD